MRAATVSFTFSSVDVEFFERLGFTETEFNVLCAMTSWAVCGVRPLKQPAAAAPEKAEDADDDDENDDEHNAGGGADDGVRYEGRLSDPAVREDIGTKCKDLLNAGRAAALETLGFETKCVQYVERAHSLENVLILARKRQ